jgi:hypothetical protein
MNPIFGALGKVGGAIGQGIGTVAQDVGNAFWKAQPTGQVTSAMPNSPMGLQIKSPVPMTPVSNQVGPYLKSPIPQAQQVSRPIAPSMAQQFGTDVSNGIKVGQNNMAQWGNLFFGNHPETGQVVRPPIRPPMQTQLPLRATPTPTPVQPTQAAFSNFTTVPYQRYQQYAPTIAQAAQQHGLDPNVLASVLFTEHGIQPTGNNYNVDANGNQIPGNYDRGMAQINSYWHPEISDQQANDPNFAINWAAKTLSGHLQNFGGDYGKAIAAYNIGEGGASNPQVFQNQGRAYLNKVVSGLTPQLAQKLGLSHPVVQQTLSQVTKRFGGK